MKSILTHLATFGWLGAFTGIIGGILLAFNSPDYSKFGFIFFLVSATSWLIQGVQNKDHPLVILNAVFIVVDMLGIYHWFIAKSPVF